MDGLPMQALMLLATVMYLFTLSARLGSRQATHRTEIGRGYQRLIVKLYGGPLPSLRVWTSLEGVEGVHPGQLAPQSEEATFGQTL